jgi:excisionase family DNA binding protein
MPEEFLTVAEVAELLKLNQQTLRNGIDAGTVPYVRLGRRIRIKRSDLDALIAAGESVPKATPTAIEVVARERLAVASRSVAKAAGSDDDAGLAAVLLELSDAARALADTLMTRESDTEHAGKGKQPPAALHPDLAEGKPR